MLVLVVVSMVIYIVSQLFFDFNKKIDQAFALIMPVLIAITLSVAVTMFYSGEYRSTDYEIMDTKRLEEVDGSYVTNRVPRDGKVTVHTVDGDKKIKSNGIRIINNRPLADHATITTIRESRVPEWLIWPLNSSVEGYILEIDDSSKMSVDPLRHVR